MTANYADVRAGIAALLDVIEDLEVKAVAPEQIDGHCAIITPPDGGLVIEYDVSVDLSGADNMGFVIHVFVPRRDEKSAQDALDGYMAKTGPLSIFAAVSGQTVTGTHYVEVLRAHSYGGYKYAGEDVFGVQFDVAAGV